MWYLDLCIWIRLAFGTLSEGAILWIKKNVKTLCLYNLENLLLFTKKGKTSILFESKKNKNFNFLGSCQILALKTPDGNLRWKWKPFYIKKNWLKLHSFCTTIGGITELSRPSFSIKT